MSGTSPPLLSFTISLFLSSCFAGQKSLKNKLNKLSPSAQTPTITLCTPRSAPTFTPLLAPGTQFWQIFPSIL